MYEDENDQSVDEKSQQWDEKDQQWDEKDHPGEQIQNGVYNANKVAKHLKAKKAAQAVKKAGAGKAAISGAGKGASKPFIITALLVFVKIFMLIVVFSFLIAIPMSAISSMSQTSTSILHDMGAWFDEMSSTLSADVSSGFGAVKESVYEFFTGDTTASETRLKIDERIKQAGKNMSGDDTEYTKTLNTEVSIIYKYYQNAYVAKKTKAEEAGSVVFKMGDKFLEDHKDELKKKTTSPPVNNPSPSAPPSSSSSNPTPTSSPRITTTTTIHQYKYGTVIPLYDGDDMGDFFKPTFYLLAADSVHSWGNDNRDPSINRVSKIATDTADDTYEISVSEPSMRNLKEDTAAKTTDKETDANGNTTVTITHIYKLTVNYRIVVTDNEIDNIVDKAGANPTDDRNAMQGTVETLCKYFGAELTDEDAGDWGTIVFDYMSSATGAIISTQGFKNAIAQFEANFPELYESLAVEQNRSGPWAGWFNNVTQEFGHAGHTGTDIANGIEGTNILAPCNSAVVGVVNGYAANMSSHNGVPMQGMASYGNYLLIYAGVYGGNDVYLAYAHCCPGLIADRVIGETLVGGSAMANEGHTGNVGGVTGIHTHVEYIYKPHGAPAGNCVTGSCRRVLGG